MNKIKFIILNKKNLPKDRLDKAQCFVKNKPQKAGDIVELDLDDELDFQAANNLSITKFGKPAEKKDEEQYEKTFARISSRRDRQQF